MFHPEEFENAGVILGAGVPRSQVALGNASVLAVALPLGCGDTSAEKGWIRSARFEDKCVPKYNLGTRGNKRRLKIAAP
jgi:hypothetical protein